MADRFGRKMTVFVGACVSTLGCALQAGAVTIAMMIAGRFIAGVAVGLLSAIVPMYSVCLSFVYPETVLIRQQSELAVARDRGKLSGLLQFMLSWGFFAAQWIGYGCFQVDSPFQCKPHMHDEKWSPLAW
jgi:MFS family permease